VLHINSQEHPERASVASIPSMEPKTNFPRKQLLTTTACRKFAIQRVGGPTSSSCGLLNAATVQAGDVETSCLGASAQGK